MLLFREIFNLLSVFDDLKTFSAFLPELVLLEQKLDTGTTCGYRKPRFGPLFGGRMAAKSRKKLSKKRKIFATDAPKNPEWLHFGSCTHEVSACKVSFALEIQKSALMGAPKMALFAKKWCQTPFARGQKT